MSSRHRPRGQLGSPLSSIVAQGSRRGLIKSIQRGTISIAGGTSNTATITAVNTANSIINLLGISYDTVNTTVAEYLARIALTNSTTVTATRQGVGSAAATVVSYEVIEFYTGVIKSIQAGTIALATVTSNTATVTAVDTTKSSLICLGWSTDDGGGNGIFFQTKIVLTNATTITATKGSATESSTVSYMLVEFF